MSKAGLISENKIRVFRIVENLEQDNFNMFISEKEGGFVVAPRAVCLEKAEVTIRNASTACQASRPNMSQSKHINNVIN